MRLSVCLAFALGPLLGCDSGLGGRAEGDGASRPLRVMTFNIGQDDGGLEGPDRWSSPEGPRRDKVADLLLDERADLFGLQDALSGQVADLATDLPDYSWVGVGLDDGVAQGEFAPIFYRADRYEHIADGTFWLSDTPNVPGSTYADAQVRIATWLEVGEIESGQPILVLNTHWDESSDEARAFGASFIVQQLSFLAPRPRAVLVVGDFNCSETSAPVVTLRDGGRLDDVFRTAHPEVGADEATSHGYTGDPSGARMDFVMASTGLFQVDRVDIVRTGGAEAGWPSDHFPVVADLRW